MTPHPRAPTPEGLNREFYEQASEGVLHLQQCERCGRFRHPPRYYCPACASPAYRWTPTEGSGRLFSWTITHFPFDRGWAEELPYASVVVELEEGVRLIGALDGLAHGHLRTGIPLVGRVDTESHGFAFVTFRPSDAGGHG